MVKTKNFIVDVTSSESILSYDFPLFGKKSPKELDFKSITLLRKIFSKNRIKILHSIKNQKPESIYSLSKLLKRDVKAVRKDLKVLEKFGLLEYLSKKKGKKQQLKPVLATDNLNILLKF